MLVLDTDHLTEIDRQSGAGMNLAARLDQSIEDKAITIVSVQEQLSGWLARINRFKDPHR